MISSPPFPFHPFPFLPSVPSPPFPGPLNPARESGERCKLPQRGLGRIPSLKSNLVHFSLKYVIWWQQLNVMIFLRINLPKFVQLNS